MKPYATVGNGLDRSVELHFFGQIISAPTAEI